ncbi:MAG: PAS domain S-box protein [Chitinivibrionales bacterium]|nr:PAS domain S-box protein [Chitinivibrionales bacterium]
MPEQTRPETGRLIADAVAIDSNKWKNLTSDDFSKMSKEDLKDIVAEMQIYQQGLEIFNRNLAGSNNKLAREKEELERSHRFFGNFSEKTTGNSIQNDREQLIEQLAREKEALAESEQLFRIMGHSIDYGVWAADASGNITHVCPKLTDMLGKSFEEVRGFGWLDTLVPEQREDVADLWMHSIRTGEPFEHEHHFVAKNGDIRIVLGRGMPVRNEKGTVVSWAGINLDITDPNRVEEELMHTSAVLKRVNKNLQESREYLNRAQEVAHIGSWRLDIREGEALCSDEACRIIGIADQKEITSEMFASIIYPDDRDNVEQMRAELMQGNAREFDNRIVVDGKVKWVRVRSEPEFDNNNVLTGGFGTIQDITELMTARKKIEDREKLFSLVLENSRDGIHLFDLAAEKLAFMSPSLEKLTGFTLDEIEQLPLGEIAFRLHPDDIETVNNYLSEIIAGNEPDKPMEYRWRIKSGEYRWFSDSRKAIWDHEGNAIALVGVSRDITDQKIMEENLRRQAGDLSVVNGELESFSYSVSHDLRNVVNNIAALIDVFEVDNLDRINETGKACLLHIKQNVSRMSDTISDLLQLSRVSKQELEITQTNLSRIAERFIDELKESNSGRRVGVNIHDNMTAMADRGLMRLVMENLIRNAWKYTSKSKQPEIEIGYRKEGQERYFFVKDNGAGFDMKDAERIFAPFQRAHSKKEYPGTGIGLSIVRRVIKKHSGEIWVESETGKGSCFYFTLG